MNEIIVAVVAAVVLWLLGRPLFAVSGTHTVGRADLAGAFEEYALTEGFFIGDQVFPIAPQSKRKGNYPVITRESLTQLHDTIRRSDEGDYQRTGFVTEDKSYACQDYGLEVRLDDAQVEELRNDYGIDVDEAASKIVWWQNKFQHEKRVADLAFDAVTNFTAGNGNYTDVSGSDPWTTVGSNILSSIQTAQEAIVAAIIAPVLGLDELLVGKAVYSSVAGMGTFSASKFWSNLYALVFVNSRESTLTAPRLGSTCVWSRRTGSNLIVIEEYREESVESDVSRAKSSTDEILHDVQFGHLLKVATS